MSNSLRVQLHNELKLFYANVYYQPPANIRMEYPCIVYSKSRESTTYADNDVYKERQAYNVTVIEKDPDSIKSKEIRRHFRYAIIQSYITIDNLHQTSLTIHY